MSKVDILDDISTLIKKEDVPLFLNGNSEFPGMIQSVKPDCPITLNILYAFFKAGFLSIFGTAAESFKSNIEEAAFATVIFAILSISFLLLFMVVVFYLNGSITFYGAAGTIALYVIIILLLSVFAFNSLTDIFSQGLVNIESFLSDPGNYKKLNTEMNTLMTQARKQRIGANCT